MRSVEAIRAYSAKRIQMARDAGLCIGCRRNKAPEGRKVCLECCENRKKRRKILTEMGKCNRCSAKLPKGWTMVQCPECNQFLRDYYETNKQKRKALGVCIGCGVNPPDDSTRHNYCRECADKYRASTKETYNLLAANGVCTCCRRDKARPGKRYCEACAKMAAVKYRQKKEAQREKRV